VGHISNLSQLKAAGGVVAREPHLITVEWEHDGDTDTVDVWVVKASLGKMLKLSDVKDRDQLALTLSETVFLADDKGKPQPMSYDVAFQLDPTLGMAILNAIGSERTKNSPPQTNSSANSSPVELVEAPLKKLANG
jgi:hypothetical protein